MDLFLREATERIGADEALAKIDALMDWPSFLPISLDGHGLETFERPLHHDPWFP